MRIIEQSCKVCSIDPPSIPIGLFLILLKFKNYAGTIDVRKLLNFHSTQLCKHCIHQARKKKIMYSCMIFSKRFLSEKLCIMYSLIGIVKYELVHVVTKLCIAFYCKNWRTRSLRRFRLYLLTVSSRDLAGRNPSRRIGAPISWLSEPIALSFRHVSLRSLLTRLASVARSKHKFIEVIKPPDINGASRFFTPADVLW